MRSAIIIFTALSVISTIGRLLHLPLSGLALTVSVSILATLLLVDGLRTTFLYVKEKSDFIGLILGILYYASLSLCTLAFLFVQMYFPGGLFLLFVSVPLNIFLALLLVLLKKKGIVPMGYLLVPLSAIFIFIVREHIFVIDHVSENYKYLIRMHYEHPIDSTHILIQKEQIAAEKSTEADDLRAIMSVMVKVEKPKITKRMSELLSNATINSEEKFLFLYFKCFIDSKYGSVMKIGADPLIWQNVYTSITDSTMIENFNNYQYPRSVRIWRDEPDVLEVSRDFANYEPYKQLVDELTICMKINSDQAYKLWLDGFYTPN